ncbi:L-2-amino-thiazoline-4-carboxylic acid hydrolase [Thermodesulfobacteriota bacterium]
MTKVEGKGVPWEQQRDMLVEAVALKLPLLYQTLKETYGEEKGRQVYDELFETNFKKRAGRFEGKSIVDIMMPEIEVFPAFGWEIWIEKTEENGTTVSYEHLGKCPHLDATRKYKLAAPCDIICDMDCKMGEKYKVGKWERMSHMPSGDAECCFKITPYV